MNGFDLGFGGRLRASLAAIVLLTGCSSGASQSPSPSPVIVRYDCAVGNQKGGTGPDIVAVRIDQPDDARVRYTVEFAAEPPLGVDATAGSTDTLMIFMGAQPDFMTTGTAVYTIGLHGGTLRDEVANGAHLSINKSGSNDLRERAVKVTVEGAVVTMTVSRTLLGDPATLYFVLGAAREGPADQGSGGDMCPEDVGEYSFAAG